MLDGRRVIDLLAFIEKNKIISDLESLFNCGLGTIKIVSEYQIGFYSRLNIQCSMCKKKFQIETTDKNINKDVVSGIMASGNGYAQLKQFTAAVDLPEIKEKQNETTS